MGIIAGLMPAWQLRMRARSVRLEIAEMDAAISTLRRIDASNRAKRERLAETNRQRSALQKLARARAAWITLFSDLQARLAEVQDAWIERLEISPFDPGELQGRLETSGSQSSTIPRDRASGAPEAPGGVRIRIAGRLFDAGRLFASTSDGPGQKATVLRAALRAAPFVSAIEHEHFDDSQPELLFFEITLRLSPDALN